MRYRARIHPAALADAEEYVSLIRDQNRKPIAAARWYDGLTGAILSLDSLPGRCPVAPEQNSFKIELRHLVYRSHRIVFHIQAEARTVHVLRVYHGAREALDSELVTVP